MLDVLWVRRWGGNGFGASCVAGFVGCLVLEVEEGVRAPQKNDIFYVKVPLFLFCVVQ